jgi:SAM-dependent methyltransferase
MREASKTRSIRPPEFREKFLSGRVLDIGCGDDLCVPYAVPFDRQHGDANRLLAHFEEESFDCVHSSHCLEHMADPVACLGDWWRLVKAGGFLVTVVPDEDLYEQGHWPSLFNSDHKHTFRLEGAGSWSPVSYCLPSLIAALPNAEIVSAQRQANGYRMDRLCRARRRRDGSNCVPGLRQRLFSRVRYELLRAGLIDTFIDRLCMGAAAVLGASVDQTLGGALAQIEVVARKAPLSRDGPAPPASGPQPVEQG